LLTEKQGKSTDETNVVGNKRKRMRVVHLNLYRRL